MCKYSQASPFRHEFFNQCTHTFYFSLALFGLEVIESTITSKSLKVVAVLPGGPLWGAPGPIAWKLPPPSS